MANMTIHPGAGSILQQAVGPLGGGGGLASPYPSPGGQAHFGICTYVAINYHPATDSWRCVVTAAQGPTGQHFVLYDGPFPITNQGLLSHFASLTAKALEDDK